MIRLYITRLKCIYRNKEVLFWNYMFPIMLATCFFLGFNNIFKASFFETIPIAYEKTEENDDLDSVLSSARLSDDTDMFRITYCSREEAGLLLEEGKINGYIIGGDIPELVIKENGINQTVLKSFLDSYLQGRTAIRTILQENPDAASEGLFDDIMNYDSYVENVRNQKKPDSLLIYFYALLAYTCVYAASSGLDEVINIQADLSSRGARLNASPISKLKLFLCNLAAAYTSQLVSILLLFLYMFYVIKVGFGDNLLYLLLICIIGSLTGLVMGACIGVWVRKKPEVQEAIVTAVVLGGSFLSGMMIADMKYLVAQKLI